MKELTTVKENGSLDLATNLEKARQYLSSSTAENTKRAYRADWQHFLTWCEGRNLAALPASPETIALYLADLAGEFKTSTISRRVIGIKRAHLAAGHISPTESDLVKEMLKGIKRKHSTAQSQKAPLMFGEISAIVRTIDSGKLKGARDKALLLLGYSGFFRRSELVGLKVKNLKFTESGVTVTIERSKTDQEGQGRQVGIPYGTFPVTCPVEALQAWLSKSGITSGPIFRRVTKGGVIGESAMTAQGYVDMIKKYCAGIGLDAENFAGHSLRAGGATQAAVNGASDRAIKKQGGWSSNEYQKYIREGNLYRDNAADKLGL